MTELKPFIIAGLALGSIYALSGVGLVVLYRATGVLNFANGAFGAFSAFVAWQLDADGLPQILALVIGVLVAGALSGIYGTLINPYFASRMAIERASATIGVTLGLLGVILLIWSDKPRDLSLSTSTHGFQVWGVYVNLTQVIALVLAIVTAILAALLLKRSRLGTVMRGLASDRQLTRMLGAPVRRAEAVAWISSGLLAGVSGVLFANLVALQATTLTFLIIGTLAAGVIGRFRSLTATALGGLVIGVAESSATPYNSITEYREAAPFVIAILVIIVVEVVRPGRERQL